MVTLNSARLHIRTVEAKDAPFLANFEAKNINHFRQYASTIKEAVTLESYWEKKIETFLHEFSNHQAIRFLLFEKKDPSRPIIGLCNFTQIFRGPFQACYLGYKIDHEFEGKELMFEALKETISYMFLTQNLHRIMANYVPTNKRSENLLDRLGFKKEGYAEKYLLINGKWGNHIFTSITNLSWKDIL